MSNKSSPETSEMFYKVQVGLNKDVNFPVRFKRFTYSSPSISYAFNPAYCEIDINNNGKRSCTHDQDEESIKRFRTDPESTSSKDVFKRFEPPKMLFSADDHQTVIYENRKLPRVPSFDDVELEEVSEDQISPPNKDEKRCQTLRIQQSIRIGNVFKLISSPKTSQQRKSQFNTPDLKSSSPLSPIKEFNEDYCAEVQNAYATLKIDQLTSRDEIKAEQKLLRESIRNKKAIRKTTLMSEIKDLLVAGSVELTDEERNMFTKVSFTSNSDEPIELRTRPKQLKCMKIHNSKKLLAQFMSNRDCLDTRTPPDPPSGDPPKSCLQPVLKNRPDEHFYRFTGMDISEMVESLHLNIQPTPSSLSSSF